MSAYTHFTPIERGHLAASLKGGKVQAYIAAELGAERVHHFAGNPSQRWQLGLRPEPGTGKLREPAQGLPPSA